MSARKAIPELLSTYVRAPDRGSLVLATHVLGATNNWLLLRYLKACLDGKNTLRLENADSDPSNHGHDDTANVSVVFVSWMRDYEFWRTEARKAVGLDLAKLQQQSRFSFIDGLRGQLVASDLSPSKSQTRARTSTPPMNRISAPPSTTPTTASSNTRYLEDTSPETIEAAIQQGLKALAPSSNAVLILDSPTLPISLQPDPSAQAFANMLMTLRSHPRLRSVIVSIPADDPFVEAARGAGNARLKQSTIPLDIEVAAFLTQCVSQSRFVISCRRLGTGWAKDVSGVLRVTRGGCAEDEDDTETVDKDGAEDDHSVVQEGEWLYHVAGDGSVKVWVRGSAAV